jgi:hypothetical protein
LRWGEKPYLFALVATYDSSGQHSRSHNDIDQLNDISIVRVGHDTAIRIGIHADQMRDLHGETRLFQHLSHCRVNDRLSGFYLSARQSPPSAITTFLQEYGFSGSSDDYSDSHPYPHPLHNGVPVH